MTTEENFGSIKRFGARYGRKPKLKYAAIEKEQKKLHKCPYCNYVKVKRIVVGVWRCSKCNSKFTGWAYSPAKKEIASVQIESQAIVQNVEGEQN